MPFFGHAIFSDIYSIPRILDTIDNKTETVVLVHMFFHLIAYHHSVFQDRMQIISKSVASLLERNKKVTVLIKGPSTTKNKYNEHFNDYFGYIYKDIMYETFREMHDKIVYLDMKDMTVAKATVDIHPPTEDVREAVYQMLDYVCE